MKHRPSHKIISLTLSLILLLSFATPAFADEAAQAEAAIAFVNQEDQKAEFFVGDEITLKLNSLTDAAAKLTITDKDEQPVLDEEIELTLSAGENDVTLPAFEAAGEYTVTATAGENEAKTVIEVAEKTSGEPAESAQPTESAQPSESAEAAITERASTLSLTGYTAPTSIKQGASFSLKGKITAPKAFTTVRIVVRDLASKDLEINVKKSVSNVKTYDLSKIDSSVKFGSLAAGSKRIYIQVKYAGSSSYTNVIPSHDFTVTSSVKQALSISGDTTAVRGNKINWKLKVGKKTTVYMFVETLDGERAFYAKVPNCAAKTYTLAWSMGVTADNELGLKKGTALPAGNYVFKVISEGVTATKEFTVTDPTVNVAITGYTPPTTLKLGSSYSLKGTIKADTPLKTVRVVVKDISTTKSEIDVSKSAGSKTTYSLSSIDSSVKFGSLTEGEKRIYILVTTTSGVVVTAAQSDFEVTKTGTSSDATYTLSGYTSPGTMAEGTNYSIAGTLKCTKEISTVKIYVKETSEYETVASATATGIGAASYSLANLASQLDLSGLAQGSYVLYITATAKGEDSVTVKSSAFTVTASKSSVKLTGYTPPTSITQGKAYAFSGTLTSTLPIKKVRGVITDVTSGEIELDVSESVSNATTHSLSALNQLVTFGKLTAGDKKFAIIVTDSLGATTVADDSFTVVPVTIDKTDATAKLTGYTAPSMIVKGNSYAISGTITAEAPLTRVRVAIRDVSSGDLEIDVSDTWDAGQGPTTYSIKTIDSRVKFGTLSEGSKYIYIQANVAGGSTITLSKKEFTVESSTAGWERVPVISSLSSWFGSDVYRYYYQQPDKSSRAIVVDPDWEKENLITFPFFHRKYTRINVAAKSYFTKAVDYITNNKIKIQYTDKTVTINVSDLILGDIYDGAYNARMTSSGSFSGHAFGLVIDVNPMQDINSQVVGSHTRYDTIMTYVKKLSYVGKASNGSGTTYTVKYNGKAPTTSLGVPMELVNYLLYEAAFKQAGFYWGGYFTSTDAMHYSLYEKPARTAIDTIPKG